MQTSIRNHITGKDISIINIDMDKGGKIIPTIRVIDTDRVSIILSDTKREIAKKINITKKDFLLKVNKSEILNIFLIKKFNKFKYNHTLKYDFLKCLPLNILMKL